MQRKSQLSILTLTGIVVFFIVILIFITNPDISIPGTRSETVLFQNYVEGCLEQTAEEAIYTVMLQGGTYWAFFPTVDYFGLIIPVYWFEENHMPTQEEIAFGISSYVENNLFSCIDEFSEFQAQGYEIIANEPTVETVFGETDTLFTLSYPLSFRRGSTTYALDEFSASLSFPLATYISYAETILNQQGNYPNDLPLGTITALADEHDFTYELIHHDENTVLISLLFEIPNKEDLIYAFAHRYNWEDTESEEIVG